MNAQAVADLPIGVFDSGVGGLSILQALQKQMPQEAFVYLADSAHAPYGERDDAYVLQRAREVLSILKSQHQIKALVVACNTATALTIHVLRQENPDLPVFGVEPAIKPAAMVSRTKKIGVIATAATLNSAKFLDLHHSLQDQAEFVLQACEGLADAIEQQWQQADDRWVQSLCRKYLEKMGEFGASPGRMDTLVLGCTHYPFAKSQLTALLGPEVTLIDTGAPVAKRVQQVMREKQLLSSSHAAAVQMLATGDTRNLHIAAKVWLDLTQPVTKV